MRFIVIDVAMRALHMNWLLSGNTLKGFLTILIVGGPPVMSFTPMGQLLWRFLHEEHFSPLSPSSLVWRCLTRSLRVQRVHFGKSTGGR